MTTRSNCLSPEARLVTECTREQHGDSARAISEAARSVQDWHKVVDLTIRHRVPGYVLRSTGHGGSCMPETARAPLVAEMTASAAVTMLLDVKLAELVEALAAESVAVLVLKGPAVARTLYPELRLRPYADLDITVQQEHESQAAAALLELGYRELLDERRAAHHGRSGDAREHGHFHRQFADETHRALVELHVDPLQLGVGPVCEAERWTRSVAMPQIAGARMLAPEDQIVQLSVHAHKHGFSRLIWLKDLDLLLRAHSHDLDWQLIHDVAREEGVVASVWYTLVLTCVLLGTPRPRILDSLRPPFHTRWLYEVVWPVARVANLESSMHRRAVQFDSADAWRGMLPSLLIMGRRSLRARLILRDVLGR